MVVTAKEMALEIERNVGLATPTEVSAVVERLASEVLKRRQEELSAIEIAAADLIADESQLPLPSLALPTSEETPVLETQQYTAPVLLRPPATPPAQPPRSDSAFQQVHTQTTTEGAALIVPESIVPKPIRVEWIVLGFCLALVGIVLGLTALMSSNKRTAWPAPSGSAPPVIVAPLAQTGSAAPKEPPPAVTPEPVPEPPSPPPTTTPSASPKPTASASVAPRPKRTAPTAPATTTTTPSASPKPTASASVAPRPKRTAPTAPATTTSNSRKGCAPPFTADAVGRKHYKPECFDTL